MRNNWLDRWALTSVAAQVWSRPTPNRPVHVTSRLAGTRLHRVSWVRRISCGIVAASLLLREPRRLPAARSGTVFGLPALRTAILLIDSNLGTPDAADLTRSCPTDWRRLARYACRSRCSTMSLSGNSGSALQTLFVRECSYAQPGADQLGPCRRGKRQRIATREFVRRGENNVTQVPFKGTRSDHGDVDQSVECYWAPISAAIPHARAAGFGRSR